MAVFTEARHAGEAILSEANGHRSRENITIAESQTIKANAVLGKVTVGGQYVVLNPDGADGSENAAAIAIYPATTDVGETADIAALLRDAEVNGNCLEWPDGIEQGEKDSAVAALAALGIIVR